MDIIKSLKNNRNNVWKEGERKAKKIRKLIGRFSKQAFDRKMLCGLYSIQPVTEKDVKIFDKIASLYIDEVGVAEIHVNASMYELGFRRFSIDRGIISFSVVA